MNILFKSFKKKIPNVILLLIFEIYLLSKIYKVYAEAIAISTKISINMLILKKTLSLYGLAINK